LTPPERSRRLYSIGAAYVLTWAFISWLTVPALDSYGDMVENYAWSQAWAWGTFRHPPLFAWIVGVWFKVFPAQAWPYYVLSYLNAWIGILGILWLARLWVPDTISATRREAFDMLVLLFAALSLPYSNLAAKFNADTVLLSLWPWTAYAFFAALGATEPRRQWGFTLLLAALAAAAMLGKYYSGLLLVSLLIISCAEPEYRRWYRTVYPYVAVVLFVLLLVPHALWEARAGFPFRDYLESKVDETISIGRIVLFLLSGIYYLPASWLAWLIVRGRLTSSPRQRVAWTAPVRPVVLLCILPAVLTTAFNVFARIHLTTHWAIPVWFGLPVLMAIWLLPDIGDDFARKRFERGVAATWVAVLAGAMCYAVALSVTGDARYSLARQEMVDAIGQRFTYRFPTAQLAWAGGAWPESGALAFFGAGHPRALPGVPDDPRALANPYPAWREQFGVLICYAGGAYAKAGARDTECEAQVRTWLKAQGLNVAEETLTYQANGWRFRRAQPKNVTVFWVPPSTGRR
jgi:4-amino-4-deoxy-L-arabinose transferase-like glycosyltransferase